MNSPQRSRLHDMVEGTRPLLLRPPGWRATGDEGRAFLQRLRLAGHVYRGMTDEEYQATVGRGQPIFSGRQFSHAGEGTSFDADPETAESYVNFGRDDPRVTGRPTWLVEVGVMPAIMYRDRDGYVKAREPVPLSAVSRRWKMFAEGDAVYIKAGG